MKQGCLEHFTLVPYLVPGESPAWETALLAASEKKGSSRTFHASSHLIPGVSSVWETALLAVKLANNLVTVGSATAHAAKPEQKSGAVGQGHLIWGSNRPGLLYCLGFAAEPPCQSLPGLGTGK
jgi:hypothetical protein